MTDRERERELLEAKREGAIEALRAMSCDLVGGVKSDDYLQRRVDRLYPLPPEPKTVRHNGYDYRFVDGTIKCRRSTSFVYCATTSVRSSSGTSIGTCAAVRRTRTRA